jgi:YfiH family protein
MIKTKFTKEKIEIISSETLDGSMSLGGQDDLFVNPNAQKFISDVVGRENFAYMRQSHSNNVKIIDEAGIYDCDGLMSSERLCLGVRSADCVPVMLFGQDDIKGVIHVSRASLLKGIIGQSLVKVLEEMDVNKNNLKVYLGPHIRQKNYKLSGAHLAKIEESRFGNFLQLIKGESYFDMTGSVIAELMSVGFKPENIYDSKIDTFENKKFFSFRRDGGDGGVKTFLTIIKDVN